NPPVLAESTITRAARRLLVSTISPPAPTTDSPPQTHPAPAVSRSVFDRTGVCVTVLLVWCGLLFFYGIGDSELWRTESLRAIIGREFLQSGNWVVPRLYGEPLFTKPPGMYALIALCSAPFGGVTEWTARLPAALAATLTVLMFFWYFGRELGRR